MRLLDRYILQEILRYAGLGLGVFLFVLMTPEVLRLSELLAQENIALPQMVRLFLSVLPAKLVWALPLSVLTGLLVAISRLAADSEVIAMQATGMGPRGVLGPALAFAAFGAALTLATTAWWGPAGARTIRALQAELAAGQAPYEVRPRVFDERFPNMILYVQDTEQGGGRWKGVFLADLSDRDNPQLTLAQQGVVVPELDLQRLRLHLFDGSSHAYSAEEPERYSVSTFGENILTLPLPAGGARLEPRRHSDLGLTELWAASQSGPNWRSARADFHRRLALPSACLLFAFLGLPLGMLAQRTGRSVGFVAAITLAIGYYFIFLLGDRLARDGALPPVLGTWLANLVLLVLVLSYLRGQRWLRPPPQLPFANGLRSSIAGLLPSENHEAPLSPAPGPLAASAPQGPAGSRLPRTLDLYVLRGVLSYFALLLLALLLIFSLFTVLEMMDDITANNVPWPVVARFLWYLLPQALYWMAPLALLLALLVELALLSKRNELVAIMGAGISLYRIAAPLLLLGFGLSLTLFWLGQQYLPHANQRQEALYNQIKGRSPRTFYQTYRRWLIGEQSHIYHYAFFDPHPSQPLLGGLNVLEIDPQSFRLRRRLFARRASWKPQLTTWHLQDAWERNFRQDQTVSYQPCDLSTCSELTEDPSYFQKEVRESAEMNWLELGDYITDLKQSGFDVTLLRVEWHNKFAFPLIATFVVPLAFPFGLRMGPRGAVGGIALGIVLGFVYWIMAWYLKALGNFGFLPPLLAAWGPNLVFGIAAFYLILQLDT